MMPLGPTRSDLMIFTSSENRFLYSRRARLPKIRLSIRGGRRALPCQRDGGSCGLGNFKLYYQCSERKYPRVCIARALSLFNTAQARNLISSRVLPLVTYAKKFSCQIGVPTLLLPFEMCRDKF